MKSDSLPRKQHWVFLTVFSLCALLGFGSLLVGELFLPDNPGGNQGRLAMYRSLGMMSVIWLSIAIWSGNQLWTTRTSCKQ